MLGEIPKGFGKVKEEDPRKADAELLRIAIIAELDAVNLYEQLAAVARDPLVKRVFEEIAREEKTHVGEFLALLKRLDPAQVEELKKGQDEVEELEPHPPKP